MSVFSDPVYWVQGTPLLYDYGATPAVSRQIPEGFTVTNYAAIAVLQGSEATGFVEITVTSDNLLSADQAVAAVLSTLSNDGLDATISATKVC